MAVFRVTSRTWTRPAAKATVRYIAHAHRREIERPGEPRKLFGRDGEELTKYQAYRLIDRAKGNTTFFRLVISPDRKKEDQDKRLDLKTLTENTMMLLQDRFPHQTIPFVAAIHTNTDNRHVHVLALVPAKRLPQKVLTVLTETATNEARLQRQELDRDITPSSTGTRSARVGHTDRIAPRQVASASVSRSRISGSIKREPRVQLGRLGPSCPNCGPWQEMERRGRQFECLSCGLRLKRSARLGAEIVHAPSLELSLEGVRET
jgi:hypothetical protein